MMTRTLARCAAILLLLWVSVPAFLQLRLNLMAAAAAAADADPGLLRHAAPLWVHIVSLSLLLALLGRTRRLLWLLVPAALLAPLEAFYLLKFELPSGAHVYGVIADTDRAEAASWLGPWVLPLLLGLLALLALVLYAARQWWRADWRWQHRSRYWVLAAGGLLLVQSLLVEGLTADIEATIDLPSHNRYLQHSLNAPDDRLRSRIEASFPWGLPLRWARFVEHQQALAAHRVAVAGHDFGVVWRSAPAAQKAQRQIHVLVIGETGRPDRWQLFGAPRATTPRLSARRDQLLVFGDAVSGASATREAVPLMLTRRPPSAMLAPPSEPSVVTAFRQAGFKTYWLSTQGAAGAHETPVSVIASEAHEQLFVNAADYRGTGAHDGILLPHLQQILDRAEPRQLIVLHTLGSHLHYAHRHPAEFAQFQPALSAGDRPDIWRETRVEEMRNSYDNSVLYTDYVLDEALKAIAATGQVATLLYAADHGETLYDGDCGRAGHGFAAAVNYRVPLFIWLSPEWRRRFPEVQAALQARQEQPVSTLSVFPTLLGLAGLDIGAASAHPDLGGPARAAVAREVTHFGDFDRNLKGRSCDSKPKLKPGPAAEK